MHARQMRGAFRMKERTSHLAGLWIDAAISNTFHSNKAGSTTAKRARLTGKGSSSTTVLSH
jgi:ABC-type phosphate transport system substrate-binding protein